MIFDMEKKIGDMKNDERPKPSGIDHPGIFPPPGENTGSKDRRTVLEKGQSTLDLYEITSMGM